MKKYVAFILTLFLALPAIGQFRDNFNVSLFSGAYIAQQNAYNRGGWYGVYAEYMPIKTYNGFNFGFCGVFSQTGFKSNDSISTYRGSSTDFGGGLAAGKYVEFLSATHSAYFGSNLMIKSSQDRGTGLSVQENGGLGEYTMKQKDLLLAGEININLLKTFGFRENLFPRTQLRLSFQTPLKSQKNSFWNDSPIKESQLWNKSAYGVEFKQSIVQFGTFTLLEPKLYTGYYHYRGDGSNWFAIGPELALKKRGWDDFLSFYFLVKKQIGDYEPNLNSTQFVFGVNIMPFNFKKY